MTLRKALTRRQGEVLHGRFGAIEVLSVVHVVGGHVHLVLLVRLQSRDPVASASAREHTPSSPDATRKSRLHPKSYDTMAVVPKFSTSLKKGQRRAQFEHECCFSIQREIVLSLSEHESLRNADAPLVSKNCASRWPSLGDVINSALRPWHLVGVAP